MVLTILIVAYGEKTGYDHIIMEEEIFKKGVNMKRMKLFKVLITALMLSIFTMPASAVDLDETTCIGLGGSWNEEDTGHQTCSISIETTITSNINIRNPGNHIELYITDGGSITINHGVTINIEEGGFIIKDSQTFTPVAGTIQNHGRINIREGGQLSNFYGTINNDGVITNYGEFSNYDIIRNDGNIYNNGNFINGIDLSEDGGTIINSGTISNRVDGTIDNYGTINNRISGTIYNHFTIINRGNINNLGAITNRVGGTINNFGKIYNLKRATIYNHFSIINHGTINNDGIVTNRVGGTIDNRVDGTIRNSVTIYNRGVIYNCGTITGNPILYNPVVVPVKCLREQI